MAAGIATVALLLGGCGYGAAPSASPRPTPSATAAPPPLLVVADPAPYSGPQQSLVRFFALDGTELAHVAVATGDEVVGVAGGRVFVLAPSGILHALHRDGSVEQLGDLGSGPIAFKPSPDGTRWLWSTASYSGTTISSALHLGGVRLTPRVVESATEENRALRPYEWTSVGVFVEHGAVGIGGYIPYSPATGPVDRLDLEKGTPTPVANSASCQFSDMSADGTIACFPRPLRHLIRLAFGDGRVTDIPLSTPRFNLTGDAYFSPGGHLLTVAGAVGVGFVGGEHYGTDLIKTDDGSISRLSLEGVRPAEFMRAACWLTDDTLVVYRPSNSASGPGVFVYSQSGASTLISNSGVPVGILTG